MKRLIYIIGSGRSGSTILDIVLGNSENCFSAGELNRFAKRNGYPPKRLSDSKSYKFWNELREELGQNIELDFEYLNRIYKKFEHYSAIIPVQNTAKNEYNIYKNILLKFYDLLWAKTNGKILIESSKYPLRALNLSKILGCRIDFIYLKRDPAHVVRSFGKSNIEQPQKGFIKANLYYFIANTYCTLISKNLKKRGFQVVELRYEEFVKNPDEVLKRLSKELNLEMENLRDKIRFERSIPTNMLFDGNRIRLRENLVLKRSLKEYNNLKDDLSRIINSPFY